MDVDRVLNLLQHQPTLLCTSAKNIASTVDVLSSCLGVSAGQGLDLLVRQPALLYDFGRDTLELRLEQLATTFKVRARGATA